MFFQNWIFPNIERLSGLLPNPVRPMTVTINRIVFLVLAFQLLRAVASFFLNLVECPLKIWAGNKGKRESLKTERRRSRSGFFTEDVIGYFLEESFR